MTKLMKQQKKIETNQKLIKEKENTASEENSVEE